MFKGLDDINWDSFKIDEQKSAGEFPYIIRELAKINDNSAFKRLNIRLIEILSPDTDGYHLYTDATPSGIIYFIELLTLKDYPFRNQLITTLLIVMGDNEPDNNRLFSDDFIRLIQDVHQEIKQHLHIIIEFLSSEDSKIRLHTIQILTRFPDAIPITLLPLVETLDIEPDDETLDKMLSGVQSFLQDNDTATQKQKLLFLPAFLRSFQNLGKRTTPYFFPEKVIINSYEWDNGRKPTKAELEEMRETSLRRMLLDKAFQMKALFKENTPTEILEYIKLQRHK